MSKIYLDLDGVLVDFVRGALEHHESDIDPLTIGWNIASQVCPKDHNSFWNSLDYAFWEGLPWTREGKQFYYELTDLTGEDNIFFCTGPPPNLHGLGGKIAWLRSNVPEICVQYHITAFKGELARPNILLIDDKEENCKSFFDNGGHSVLIPRMYNKLKHKCKADGTFCIAEIILQVDKALKAMAQTTVEV